MEEAKGKNTGGSLFFPFVVGLAIILLAAAWWFHDQERTLLEAKIIEIENKVDALALLDPENSRGELVALGDRVDSIEGKISTHITNHPGGGRSVLFTSLNFELVETIYFGNRESTLDSEDVSKLNKIAGTHGESEKIISLRGSADTKGVSSFNATLSRSRTKAVRDHLIKEGIEPYRILTIGLGEELAPVSTLDNTDESRNRVVEVYLADQQNSEKN